VCGGFHLESRPQKNPADPVNPVGCFFSFVPPLLSTMRFVRSPVILSSVGFEEGQNGILEPGESAEVLLQDAHDDLGVDTVVTVNDQVPAASHFVERSQKPAIYDPLFVQDRERLS
jgi:hypothetical protein